MRDYAKAERRSRLAESLDSLDAAAKAEQSEKVAAILRIEKHPNAYAISFPGFDPKNQDVWRIMREVKALTGRRFDSINKVWSVPLSSSTEVEALAATYGLDILTISDDPQARIAELERALAVVTAERDAAIALSDEYAAMLDSREAVAA
jgi:hypothetical protein